MLFSIVPYTNIKMIISLHDIDSMPVFGDSAILNKNNRFPIICDIIYKTSAYKKGYIMERLVEKKEKVAETTVILGLLAITLILAGL